MKSTQWKVELSEGQQLGISEPWIQPYLKPPDSKVWKLIETSPFFFLTNFELDFCHLQQNHLSDSSKNLSGFSQESQEKQQIAKKSQEII